MAHELARIAARLFNTPLLVLPDTAETIASNLAGRLGIEPMQAPDPKALSFGAKSDEEAERKPYKVQDGIAVIPVRGELVNRGSWMDAFSGLTAYETLSSSLRAAEADGSVRGIVLDIDSGGGEASGAMETAAVVRAVSKNKRVVAFVNACACSAAYAIAAGASQIVVVPSAIVGSIGVVWLHMDYSKALEEAGVKPTFLFKGAFKKDGNQLEPLDPAAKKRIGSMISSYYDLFVESVGAHRKKLGEAGARETEAGIFVGQAALDANLADDIGTMADVLESFPQRSFAQMNGAKSMDTAASITLAAHQEALTKAEATHKDNLTAALAKASADSAAAISAARLEGSATERARVGAILRSPEADGRTATALTLALDNEMTAEAAVKVLGSVPKSSAADPKLGSRLDGIVPRPDVKPDQNDAGAKTDYQRGAEAAAAVLGRKPK